MAVLIFYSLNLRAKSHATPFERTMLSLVSPFAETVSSVSDAVTGVWSNYIDLVNVRQENKQLRDSVKLLNSRMIAAQEALNANTRLQRLLDLRGSLDAPSIAASVIGDDGSAWYKTLLINRGEKDGIREGMPVVAAEGVVGQVAKVGAGSSRVLLMTDYASGVAAVVQRSRARGVVKGAGGGRCTLAFTVRDDDVKVGDMVVTSGIGGVFPKGLAVGEVTMVKKGDYGIFQTIDIRPAVNLIRLEEVLVLLHTGND
ncbi:rod shape-determining protein MreC [Geobacter sp. DSM 9736]|uniref:rod shape-determining protein MreC n=1 Tax=Geobacter sp. DSM 9736 TaxID=1277350 RepID=UPI001E50D77E|nr:rod shape-determining protein MreC [Geobacter sp. DSM 9736]